MSDTDIDVDDIDSDGSDYEEEDEEFDIIVCSQCSIEIDNNEDYKQITYGVNYCIACYEMLAEQEQNKQ